jgi:hypothetical protein
MITKDDESAFAEICKLPDDSINKLIEKFSESFNDGSAYLENLSSGFKLRVIKDVEDVEIKGLDKRIGELFFPLVIITEFFIHNIDKEEELVAKKIGFDQIEDNKIKLLWKKLHDTGVLNEIDYQIHTTGDRLIGPSVFAGDKLVMMYNTNRYHQCAEILFKVNSGEKTNRISFEVDKTSLNLLLQELQAIKKEMDESIKQKVAESNE